MATLMTEHTVADYVALLESSMKTEAELGLSSREQSRLEFLGRGIFEFDTDDGDVDEEFAVLALRACHAITSRSTYQLIEKSRRHYLDFLLMLNMEFFKDKTESGTSIRGSWWVHSDIELRTSSLWTDEKRQIPGPIVFSRNDWLRFVDAMFLFAQDEMKAKEAV
ncbi:hypothetical protein [Ralstonia phage phiRSL1]|uniref:Uncharacterized protein n=1 Tax=Ralstonia phage phiRSL1 TaxID=1980924 RepID=B2ZYA6_9CAUD|nr:hypothetical protein RSL1_ORF293 [Ralstonia phage phiRSL1]BAG41739.1 hypothetical protein [Ralstonia phage phiRSL1]